MVVHRLRFVLLLFESSAILLSFFFLTCKEDRLFITRSSDKLWKFKLSPYHDDFWINISFFGKEYQLKKRINQELVSQEFFLLDIYYTILGISKFKVKV